MGEKWIVKMKKDKGRELKNDKGRLNLFLSDFRRYMLPLARSAVSVMNGYF